MAAYPRRESIGEGTSGTYHAHSVCLKHTVLDGIHPASKKSTRHRRDWISERVGSLQAVFAVKVLAVTVGKRRLDLVLSCLPDVSLTWSPEEVVWRWTRLFGQQFGPLHRETFSALAGKKSLVAEWRKRLTSVSWFMRGINEWLAREINKEEWRKGQVWKTRFHCRKLGKREIGQTVADLEGEPLVIPTLEPGTLFPGIDALPEAPPPPVRLERAAGKAGRDNSNPVQPRLTPEARFEILRRLASGERGSRLAREFGCTRQAISLLWQKHLANPKGFNKRLTREEIRELEKEVRAATSRRKAPALSTKEVHAMAEKKFRRKLFYLPIQKLWQSWAD